MTTTKLLSLAMVVLFPTITHAQPSATVFNPAAANKVLERSDVKNSIADTRKLDLSRLKFVRALGFEDGAMCVTPMPIAAPNIDMHRSLFVHDDATLSAGNFSLRRTLQKLADDVVASAPGTTPETIFKQFWDTQNDTANQETAGNPHCSDNNGKINDIPLNRCPRPEGIEASGTPADIINRVNNDYKPVALVNRIDLADQGWKNCGEHRIVYGKNASIKNLIIFEAVLPNPKPGCRSGCRDVIEFWVDLSNDSAPASRAAKLENFFYNGLPGFRPVVHTSHYASGVSSVYGGSGSGQIRTNQFLFRAGMPPTVWTLKEFKTLLSCAGGICDYDFFPVSVKGNPYGVLWNRDIATGDATPDAPLENAYATPIPGIAVLATNFQGDVIAQVTPALLANPDINSISYQVDPDKNSAESQSQNPTFDHYPNQFAGAADATFSTNLNTVATGFGLSGVQVVNRATAMSCAGCHLPNGFGLTNPNAIGPGMSWPSALAFVHVDTPPMISLAGQVGFDPAQFGGNTQGFNISPALLDTFLPARRNSLTNLANQDVCDCVRKAIGPLPLSPIVIRKHREIIALSNQQIKDQLTVVKNEFIKKPSVKPVELQRLFIQQKAVIAKAETTRNTELEKSGIKFEEVSLKPEPVILSNQKLSDDQLKKMKVEKMNQIISAEPPRKSITGSFRSH